MVGEELHVEHCSFIMSFCYSKNHKHLTYITHFKKDTWVNLDTFEKLRIKNIIKGHKLTKYFYQNQTEKALFSSLFFKEFLKTY